MIASLFWISLNLTRVTRSSIAILKFVTSCTTLGAGWDNLSNSDSPSNWWYNVSETAVEAVSNSSRELHETSGRLQKSERRLTLPGLGLLPLFCASAHRPERHTLRQKSLDRISGRVHAGINIRKCIVWRSQMLEVSAATKSASPRNRMIYRGSVCLVG